MSIHTDIDIIELSDEDDDEDAEEDDEDEEQLFELEAMLMPSDPIEKRALLGRHLLSISMGCDLTIHELAKMPRFPPEIQGCSNISCSLILSSSLTVRQQEMRSRR